MIRNSSYDSINELLFDKNKLVCEDWEISIAQYLKDMPLAPTRDTSYSSGLNFSDFSVSETFDQSPKLVSSEICEKWTKSIEENPFTFDFGTPTTAHSSPEKASQNKKRKNARKECSESEAKKKPQNPLKNFPGLICQHIKTLSKKEEKDGFFEQVVNEKGLFLDERKEFKEFIDQYNKNDKTWIKITEFLQTNLKFAKGFLELVYSFLSPEYSTEFQRYLNEGKMNIENRAKLADNPQKMLEKFKKVEAELPIGDYSVYGRKRVKLY